MAKQDTKEPVVMGRPVEVPVTPIKGTAVSQGQPAAAAEHWFYNQGQMITFVKVTNTGEKPVTLTFQNQDASVKTVFAPKVAAGQVAYVGPFSHVLYNDILDRVWFTLDATEGITLEVLRLGR